MTDLQEEYRDRLAERIAIARAEHNIPDREETPDEMRIQAQMATMQQVYGRRDD